MEPKESITISEPKFERLKFSLVGNAPLMQARFSAKAMQAMKAKHIAGSTASKGKKREPRDFNADFEGAKHIATEGWCGLPAAAIRSACIDVCRMVGFKMTHAKMSVFVEADGIDIVDGAPLVRICADEPEAVEMATRNATGVTDIRIRPMWRKWKLSPILRYDADQFTRKDVENLMKRAGIQVGIGEGRPYSKSSNGLGFGTWDVESVEAAT